MLNYYNHMQIYYNVSRARTFGGKGEKIELSSVYNPRASLLKSNETYKRFNERLIKYARNGERGRRTLHCYFVSLYP